MKDFWIPVLSSAAIAICIVAMVYGCDRMSVERMEGPPTPSLLHTPTVPESVGPRMVYEGYATEQWVKIHAPIMTMDNMPCVTAWVDVSAMPPTFWTPLPYDGGRIEVSQYTICLIGIQGHRYKVVVMK